MRCRQHHPFRSSRRSFGPAPSGPICARPPFQPYPPAARALELLYNMLLYAAHSMQTTAAPQATMHVSQAQTSPWMRSEGNATTRAGGAAEEGSGVVGGADGAGASEGADGAGNREHIYGQRGR